MRERKIIKELVSTNKYLNVNYFANLYNVSTRTIVNDMNYLLKIAKNNGFEIELKRGEGYFITIIDEGKCNQFIEDTEDIGKENRKPIIISMLLLTTKYLTQDEIASRFQVSKSLIKLDMNEIESDLKEMDIAIERKAHYGIKAVASTSKRIDLLVQLLTKQPHLYDVISDEVNKSEAKQIEKILIELFKQNQLNANYAEMIKLDCFLKVIILLVHHNINNDKEELTEDLVYQKIAKELCETIFKEYQYDCTSYIGEMAKWIKAKSKSKTDLFHDDKIEFKVSHFLEVIDKTNNTHFHTDEEFKKTLLAHVILLVERSIQEIFFDNPLVLDISAKYPAVFNVAIQFVKLLENEYNIKITQDEIGFIATHFAAKMEKDFKDVPNRFSKVAILCSSGGGSAFIIKCKIESIFPNSEIHTFSFFDLDEVRNFNPNIIFTIRDIEEKFDVPIVKIKELIDDADVKRIKTILSNTSYEKFINLFKKENFWLLPNQTYMETLHFMADSLETSGQAKEGYSKDVEKREKVLSTVYQNGLAIPHPIEMASNINCIGVGIYTRDIEENKKKVKVIFMVNFEKGNLELHQQVSQILFELMQEEKSIQLLQSSKSYEEFIKNMSSMIEKR